MKTRRTPLVGVQMVAYNAHATLREAVDSVLAQDVSFHLYLVDDGSTPSVAESFPEYASHPKITLMRRARCSQTQARNHALRALLKQPHPYMAVMDADDVCLPGRFEKQVAFLNANPDVAWVGSWAKVIDAAGQVKGVIQYPTDDAACRRAMLLNNAFVHPSVMVRTDTLREVGLYNTCYAVAQDYELAARVMRKYKVANIPEYLVLYRMSGKNISMLKVRQQLWAAFKIQLKNPHPFIPLWWYALVRTFMRFCAPTLLKWLGHRIKKRG